MPNTKHQTLNLKLTRKLPRYVSSLTGQLPVFIYFYVKSVLDKYTYKVYYNSNIYAIRRVEHG